MRSLVSLCLWHSSGRFSFNGSSVEGALDDSFFSFLHPVDNRLFRRVWRNVLETGSTFEVEVRLLGSDGSYRWFLIRSIPRLSEEGRIARWYGIHIDIEQQFRAQQGLVVAQDELSRLSRVLSLGELAGSIAHELNQPLTALVTHAHACREWLHAIPPNIEKATVTANKIVQESTRAGAVVARLRALFRKEATIRKTANLNLLAMDLVRLLRDEAVRRDTVIKLELAEGLPNTDLDPIQIQQVLLNLVANGMDAMEGASSLRELTIRSKKHAENEIQITVEDRGARPNPEAAARMFEPFFSTKPHGFGMGLAIRRSVIEAHEGRIWATESPRGGTAFHFTIRVQS